MKNAKRKRNDLEQVEISCDARNAESVFLVGTFNAWNPSACPMKRSADGVWRVSLKVAPGIYEYKFLVDGEWVCKPGVHELDPTLLSDSDCVPSVYGTANRRVEVVLSSLVEEKVA
jgi:1,4-alpha-glucan branching enzyme